MKARELRKILNGFGCVEVRQSGSHLIVRCKACQTVVPVHTADIPPGTLRSIQKMLAPCLGEDWLKQGGPS